MKKKNVLLAVLAVSLTLSAGVGTAWSYFTTYAEANGGYTLKLGDKTTIVEEPPTEWTKHVSITSREDSEPVYVRVRAFCGSEYELKPNYSGSAKWNPNSDGYYYYSDIINGGEKTEVLDIKIENIPADEDLKNGDNFNVVVIYETTPVRYREDGTPYADWNAGLTTGTVEGGA